MSRVCGKCDWRMVLRRILKSVLSHIGAFIMVLLYLLMGAYLFRYLEVDNEAAECRNKANLYANKLNQSVERMMSFAQAKNEANVTELLIEKALDDFAVELFKLSVDPRLDCSTIKEKGEWTLANSAFFVATVMTTIGKGHSNYLFYVRTDTSRC